MTVKRVTLVMLTVIWGAMMLSMKTEDLFDYFELVTSWVFLCYGIHFAYQNDNNR